jgi:single-strand DNA-binding protein
MQTIVITGRIAKDAEQRQAGDNTVTSFDVASDQGFGERKVTNWFRCQMWGKRGSSVQPYLLKGGMVTVSGELETSTYNDKLQLGIRVSEVQLPAKPSQGAREGARSESRNTGAFDNGFDDDPSIPF